MKNEEKITMLEEIMDLEEGTLKIDALLDDIDEWDSLSKLALIAMAKQEFNIVLKADVIKGFKTVEDICKVLVKE